MKKLIAVGIILGVLVVGVVGFFWAQGVNNHMIDLENVYAKQEGVLESFYDKMWKTLQSFGKINEQKKKDFQEVYTAIMEGRYSHGSQDGSLMKWIKEDNPQFDQTSYTKMMTAVESQREGFHREQDVMLGIVKEANDLIRKFPTRYVVGGHEAFDYVVISSSKSKNVMATREENELNLGFD